MGIEAGGWGPRPRHSPCRATTGTRVSLADFQGPKARALLLPESRYPRAAPAEAIDFSKLRGPVSPRPTPTFSGCRPIPWKAQEAFKKEARPDHWAALGRNPQDARSLRSLGRKIHVWQKPSWGLFGQTFLIGSDGRIARIWPKVKVDGPRRRGCLARRQGGRESRARRRHPLLSLRATQQASPVSRLKLRFVFRSS